VYMYIHTGMYIDVVARIARHWKESDETSYTHVIDPLHGNHNTKDAGYTRNSDANSDGMSVPTVGSGGRSVGNCLSSSAGRAAG
jgi:hypothetical protein